MRSPPRADTSLTSLGIAFRGSTSTQLTRLHLRGGGCGGSKPADGAGTILGESARGRSPVTLAAPSASEVLRRRMSKSLAPELSILSQLDDHLVHVLSTGAIRLLRVAWIKRQPAGYRIESRQELEREQAGESPLLTPTEAVDLVLQCSRAVGVLSYGWLSPGGPVRYQQSNTALFGISMAAAHVPGLASRLCRTPRDGARMLIVRTAIGVQTHIQALFWDYACLYQGKRTLVQQVKFTEGLGVMGDLYASAVATTVLQSTEIPERPHAFDGALALFELHDGVDQARIEAAFPSAVEVCITMAQPPAIVRFASHEAALAAKGAGAPAGICGGINTLYNERAYSDRGWCTFEDAVSKELVMRLQEFPRMKSALEVLPPKVFALSSATPPRPLSIDDAEARGHVQRVVQRIEAATFTGKGDQPRVIQLYKDYAERITRTLQDALATATSEPRGLSLQLPASPPVVDPAALHMAPLHLAEGQILLLRLDASSWTVGRVGAPGHAALHAIHDGPMKLSFDRCSQQAIPWRPPPDTGSDEATQRDLGTLRRLHDCVQDLRTECGRIADGRAVKRAVAAKKQEMLALAAGLPIAASIRAAASALDSLASAVEVRKLEAVAVELVQRSDAVGWRRYGAGQWLVVRRADRWVDVEVVAAAATAHTLRAESEFTLVLHPWNHAPRELCLDAFEELRAWWTDEVLRAQHSHVIDALTGRRLDVRTQCVAIEVAAGGASTDAELARVRDAGGLCGWLCAQHAVLCEGGETRSPIGVLLTGGPAAGKTSLLSHVVVHSVSQSTELVPILIKVQLLQARMLDEGDGFGVGSWNWVDAYLSLEFGAGSPLHRMLRQAMMARRALILLDGLDEGGEKRDEIERHVAEVLAPQGHVVLATSRPDGINEVRFGVFQRLALSPLTDAQQLEALELRLGKERASELQPYLQRVPTDDTTGRRITSNPLMLSMVASIFELRGELAMPETVVELYDQATKAMLARAGADSDTDLTPLLQAAFFEAHTAKQRVITSKHLSAAAQAIGDEAALEVLKEQVVQDRVPLLSLLQARPLKMQAAHLSFQEYFAARAICQGTAVLPPWSLPVWWANALRLGLEMGEPFRRGLLSACGESFDGASVRVTIGGHPSTAGAALGAALFVATQVQNARVNSLRLPLGQLRAGAALDLSHSKLSDRDKAFLASFLREFRTNAQGSKVKSIKLREFEIADGNSTSLNLGGKGLKDANLSIAAQLFANGALSKLQTLSLYHNQIGDAGLTALASACASGALAQLEKLLLEQNQIGDAGLTALASAFASGALTQLKDLRLWGNQIGDAGLTALASACASGALAQLRNLYLGGNSISNKTKDTMRTAMSKSGGSVHF